MSNELISCVCLTYGRPRVLEEAVESFLRQRNPGPAELVIVNDYAAQTIVCDAPGVRVVNLPERITPLGKKYNHALGECRGSLVAIWEDDDIYLPWRLETQRRLIGRSMSHHTAQAWFEHAPGSLVAARNLHHCNLMARYAAFEMAGGYTEMGDHCSLDADIMHRLRVASDEIDPELVWYIYRWGGTGSYHGSALRDDMSAKAAEYVERSRPETGRIELRPHWSRDWTALSKEALS